MHIEIIILYKDLTVILTGRKQLCRQQLYSDLKTSPAEPNPDAVTVVEYFLLTRTAQHMGW
jgi:hypothetical protein